MHITVIHQHDEKDCGPTCLKIIAEHYGISASLSKCRRITKLNQIGTTLYGLVQGGTELGFEAEALSGNMNELLAGIKNKSICFPFIAHTISADGYLHYCVVFGIKGKNFLISDPAIGKYKRKLRDFENAWTGYIATFKKTDAIIIEKKQRHNKFKRMRSLLNSPKKLILESVILSILTAGIGVGGSFIFQIIIDGSAKLSNNTSSYVSTIFIALILLYLLQFFFYCMRGICIAKLSKKLDFNIALPYFKKILTIPNTELETRTTGDYISRYDDLCIIRDTFAEASISLILDLLLLVFSGTALFLMNKLMFIISIGVSFLYLIMVYLYKAPLKKANIQIMHSNAIVQSDLKELISGASTIRSTASTTHFYKRIEEKFACLAQKKFRGNCLYFSQTALISLIENVGYALILWCGFVYNKNGLLSLGSLLTFYSLLAFFIQPIKNLAELQSSLQSAQVAYERLEDIMEIEDENCNKKSVPFTNGDIMIKGLGYAHNNDVIVFENLNLEIKQNEKIAILAENGSGKTTLAKIISGLYKYKIGSITINKNEIRSTDLESFHDNVCYISQSDTIFAGTLKENLLLGKGNIENSKIDQLCQRFKLDFDNKKPDIIFLEENGNNLSTGQKQKIFLARALLRTPKILILDEITSNMDSDSETEVIRILSSLNDTTIIFITNNTEVAKKFDTIYKIENKRIHIVR